jgi:hypothetical protein
MEEHAAVRLIRAIGEGVQNEIEDHERRMHLPRPRQGKVTAVPFPSVQIDDVRISRAWELLSAGATLEEAAAALDVPALALVRCLADYQPAWQQFLRDRANGQWPPPDG